MLVTVQDSVFTQGLKGLQASIPLTEWEGSALQIITASRASPRLPPAADPMFDLDGAFQHELVAKLRQSVLKRRGSFYFKMQLLLAR